MRIATLLPSATEIVCALGLGSSLVAVSHDCDYPPAVKNKLRLSSIDIEPNRVSSGEIHKWVGEKLHKGTRIYHLDQQLLKKAKPNLILTQELCEVCAPSFSDVKRATKVLGGDPNIVSLEPNGLADILQNILTVGEITGRTEKAHELVAILKERISRIRSATKAVRQRPSVFCMEWLDPPYVAGHWVPQMVEYAGGRDEFGSPGKPSNQLEWKKVLQNDPDIIVLMPCGFNMKRTLTESLAIKSYDGWRELSAVKGGRVFAVNDSAYFNRPGPRIVSGLEILAEIIHPEVFKKLAPKGSYSNLV